MAEGSRSSSSRSRGKPSTGKPASRKPATGSRGKPSSRKPASGKPSDSRGNPPARAEEREVDPPGHRRPPPQEAGRAGPSRTIRMGERRPTRRRRRNARSTSGRGRGPRSFSPEETRKFEQRQARRQKEADRIDGLRLEAKAAIDRSGVRAPTTSRGNKVTVERRPLPSRPPRQKDARKELIRVLGERNGDRAWKAYRRAAKEFEADRCSDAKVTLRPVVQRVPEIVDLRNCTD